MLGFRVDPPDRLKGIYKEIQSLHQVQIPFKWLGGETRFSRYTLPVTQVFSVSPIFGVEYKVDEQVRASLVLLHPCSVKCSRLCLCRKVPRRKSLS